MDRRCAVLIRPMRGTEAQRAAAKRLLSQSAVAPVAPRVADAPERSQGSRTARSRFRNVAWAATKPRLLLQLLAGKRRRRHRLGTPGPRSSDGVGGQARRLCKIQPLRGPRLAVGGAADRRARMSATVRNASSAVSRFMFPTVGFGDARWSRPLIPPPARRSERPLRAWPRTPPREFCVGQGRRRRRRRPRGRRAVRSAPAARGGPDGRGSRAGSRR